MVGLLAAAVVAAAAAAAAVAATAAGVAAAVSAVAAAAAAVAATAAAVVAAAAVEHVPGLTALNNGIFFNNIIQWQILYAPYVSLHCRCRLGYRYLMEMTRVLL